MSSGASAIFTGNSRYARDFQTIIDRSVAIASLPMSQLHDDRSALDARSTALDALDARFAGLQTAVESIADAMGSAAFQAEVSDSTVAAAALGAGALEGVYSIKVIDLGSYTTTLSPAADGVNITQVADPAQQNIASGTSFTLNVGGAEYDLTLSSSSLNALAAAINAQTAANVRATVVNVGSPDSPDYRLSVQSARLGDIAITLSAGAVSLLDEQARGTQAAYNVNGAKVGEVDLVAYSSSRTVAIAPGLNVTMLQTSPSAVNITVSRPSSAVAGALSAFATAYNAAVDELDTHRGQSGGALSGEAVVYSLSQSLRDLTGFEGDGVIASLRQLGLVFDSDSGRLSFNDLEFVAADFTSPAGVSSFLNAFVTQAAGVLDAVERPGGLMDLEMGSVRSLIADTDERIAERQARIDELRTRLSEQMAAADALIASIEQQYSYISNMLEAMRVSQESY
ncbi:MAG: flagellar filament capping protein FliD [Bryobacteraceae bacterium]